MNNSTTLWLIPARSGSKGIPNKNLKPFCGQSLVSRSLSLALQASEPNDTIFLSTDSEAIKSEADRLNVPTPFMRPSELATDTSSTYDVILHALKEFEANGKTFHRVVLLQPTSPFRTLQDIDDALKLWSPDIDMVVSVVKSKSNPYFNLFETNKEGFLVHSKGNGEYTRRQDAPDVWEYNGAIYVITVAALHKTPMSKFNKIIPFEMPLSRSHDLDTLEDWMLAEYLFSRS